MDTSQPVRLTQKCFSLSHSTCINSLNQLKFSHSNQETKVKMLYQQTYNHREEHQQTMEVEPMSSKHPTRSTRIINKWLLFPIVKLAKSQTSKQLLWATKSSTVKTQIREWSHPMMLDSQTSLSKIKEEAQFIMTRTNNLFTRLQMLITLLIHSKFTTLRWEASTRAFEVVEELVQWQSSIPTYRAA